MHNIAEKTKQELFHVLKTGKALHRTNLFKSLFTLAGIYNSYRGVRFTDGVSYNKRKRAVVRVGVEVKNNLKVLQDTFSEYIDNPIITENRNKDYININYSNVNWNKIDFALQNLQTNK